MLPNANRFHGRNSLQLVYKRGKQARGPLLSIKALENPRRSTYRCAVVVSKKIDKSAVARNRIRRRIYEQLRQLIEPNAKMDVMVVVHDEQLSHLSPTVLAKKLGEQLSAAGVLLQGPNGGHAIINKKEN